MFALCIPVTSCPRKSQSLSSNVLISNVLHQMNFLNRNIFWILGLAALAAIVYYFSNIVGYILIAWVLSMLGTAHFGFLPQALAVSDDSGLGPSAAALLTILTFYAMLVGVLLLFVPTIVSQARHLATVDYQALGEKMRPFFFNLDLQLHQIGLLAPNESLALETQKALSNWFQPYTGGGFSWQIPWGSGQCGGHFCIGYLHPLLFPARQPPFQGHFGCNSPRQTRAKGTHRFK
jgi:predicted PurR-regulated permease PerM